MKIRFDGSSIHGIHDVTSPESVVVDTSFTIYVPKGMSYCMDSEKLNADESESVPLIMLQDTDRKDFDSLEDIPTA